MNFATNRGRPPYEGLTPAEERVLEHIREGRPNAEIAVRLGISTSAVKYHVSNLLAKAGASSRDELRRWSPARQERVRWTHGGMSAAWATRVGWSVAGVAALTGVMASGAALGRSDDGMSSWFDGLVTTGFDGSPSDGGSGPPSISHDGRYVVFHSEATNLVPGDTNGVSDIFLFDRESGEMTRLSRAFDGGQANGASSHPRISGDGTVVVFDSEATNLVAGGIDVPVDAAVKAAFWEAHLQVAAERGNAPQPIPDPDPLDGFLFGPQVYALSLEDFAVEVLSVSADGTPGDRRSENATISADGRYVAFASLATNLVPGAVEGPHPGWFRDDTIAVGSRGASAGTQVFLRDRQRGTTTLLSRDATGTPGDATSNAAEISPDGRTVVFWTLAANLGGPERTANYEDGTPYRLGDFAWVDIASGVVVPFAMTQTMQTLDRPGLSNEAAWFAWQGSTGLFSAPAAGLEQALRMSPTLSNLESVSGVVPHFAGHSTVAVTPDGAVRAVALLSPGESAIHVTESTTGGEWTAAPPPGDESSDYDVRDPAIPAGGEVVVYRARERGVDNHHDVYIAVRP